MRIKLILGFRKDQEHSISADEAHKAYYLFLHPEMRGIFSDGLALVGSDIKRIEPDYHGSMGWNPSHILDSDDWNQIRGSSIDEKLRNVLAAAKEIAAIAAPQDINIPLGELVATKYPRLSNSRRSGGTHAVSELLEQNPR